MSNTLRSIPLVIVGGGAAGMFAASIASERRLGCLLIERKARLGSKVLMTANGRCNFTKDISPEDFLADLAEGGNEKTARFMSEAIRECAPRTIIRGFRSLNVPLRRMADARMFPADGKAATIVHVFGDILRDEEIPLLTNCPVQGIVPTDLPNGGRFIVRTPHADLVAQNVLLATGGVSYPKTGSVGDGQRFARELGHTVTPLQSGLIGLETTDRRVTALAGRRFEDGRAKVIAPDGRILYDYRGEVDCESFGLSGAAIYNCQRFIAHNALTDYSLEAWFDRQRLTFRNLKPRPLKEAIVTIGGVSKDDIDPHTMQSRKVPGLYFAGEVIDIDGPTGGYNLTLAFATARKAVMAMARTNALTEQVRPPRQSNAHRREA